MNVKCMYKLCRLSLYIQTYNADFMSTVIAVHLHRAVRCSSAIHAAINIRLLGLLPLWPPCWFASTKASLYFIYNLSHRQSTNFDGTRKRFSISVLAKEPDIHSGKYFIDGVYEVLYCSFR
jgi:hypothetical protein